MQLEYDIVVIIGGVLEEVVILVVDCGGETVTYELDYVRPGTSSSLSGFDLYRLNLIPTVISLHGDTFGDFFSHML